MAHPFLCYKSSTILNLKDTASYQYKPYTVFGKSFIYLSSDRLHAAHFTDRGVQYICLSSSPLMSDVDEKLMDALYVFLNKTLNN